MVLSKTGAEGAPIKIGLALGGGGARGLAHLGMLATLVEAGIPIHCLSGTSAGAVVAALYAAGVDVKLLQELAPRVRWLTFFRPVWPAQGLLSLEKLERWLVMMMGDLNFEDLSLPLAVVVTDAHTGQRVVFESGRIAGAVHASCAVPMIFEPVMINGRPYYDGGVIDNLPVTAARDLGADYVIGCDVFEPDYDRGLGPVGLAFSAAETLIRHAGGGVDAADFLIEPRLADRGYAQFLECMSIMERGQAAAEAVLPDLLADLAARGVVLPKPA